MIINKLALASILLSLANLSVAQNLDVLTYNIRYGLANDGENRWDLRKTGLAKQLLFYEPDVFGVQEALDFQVAFLDSVLQEYDYYGLGREDGHTQGETTTIFFKKAKFRVLEKTTFWLSETPEVVSTGWDAALPRICSAVLLQLRENGRQFWVMNTHFDHVGVEARKNSAKLIVAKMHEINRQNLPLILMGDFNLEPHSEAIQYLSMQLHDSKKNAKRVVFGPEGTFQGFNLQDPLTRRIDYIFTDKTKVEVLKYAVLTDSKNQKFYSDHLPVFVELLIK
ncbi:MAG: endonuclease/exonuclease/phosphatase family protein [Cyclobacteriaceae bacterium]|nr:endonuclease/exonuclease/phosphatase family protein [Cyclobacteriaceae bacterium]